MTYARPETSDRSLPDKFNQKHLERPPLNQYTTGRILNRSREMGSMFDQSQNSASRTSKKQGDIYSSIGLEHLYSGKSLRNIFSRQVPLLFHSP